EAFPAPKMAAFMVTRSALLSWMRKGKVAGKDCVLVDVRRTDFEGGTIHGSINLPAQSLHPTIPSLYTLFSAAGITTVIWYCGNSRGRGPRSVAWFADYIQDQKDTTKDVEMMDGYNADAWGFDSD
ncbi:uncharacterized protein LY89DRAFT_582268, partial [Mollisia scopiformis]